MDVLDKRGDFCIDDMSFLIKERVDDFDQRSVVLLPKVSKEYKGFKVVRTPDSNPMENHIEFCCSSEYTVYEEIKSLGLLYDYLGALVIKLPINKFLYDSIYVTDTSSLITVLNKDSLGRFERKKTILLCSQMFKMNRRKELLCKLEHLFSPLFYDLSEEIFHFIHSQNWCSNYDGAYYYDSIGRYIVAQTKNFMEYGDLRIYSARGLILLGYNCSQNSSRSSEMAHYEFETITGIEILSLKLKHPFYHLDTACFPLPCGRILIYKDAFTAESYYNMVNIVGKGYLIEVSREDALNFGLNGIVINHFNIVTTQISLLLQSVLNQLGYDVFLISLKCINLGGGAVNCVTDIISQFIVEGGAIPSIIKDRQSFRVIGRSYQVSYVQNVGINISLIS